jgi:hypothetical protein
MTYVELEDFLNDAVEGIYITEKQVLEIENRVRKLGVEDAPEVAQIVTLLRQLLFKTQEKFNEKQMMFLSGKTEVD